jgi:hypothetical protein
MAACDVCRITSTHERRGSPVGDVIASRCPIVQQPYLAWIRLTSIHGAPRNLPSDESITVRRFSARRFMTTQFTTAVYYATLAGRGGPRGGLGRRPV